MGSIRKRSKRGWTIQWDEPRGPDGKRRRRTKVIHGTKQEAEDALAEIERRIRTGEYIKPSKLTVAEYLEIWLAQYAVANVAPKTRQEYEKIIKNHLTPALGRVPLQQLTPMQVQTYYTEALKSGRLDGKGGLSPLTVRHHHTLLHRALHQAVRWQLLSRNPVDAVDSPRVPKTEMKVLHENEISVLIDAVRETSLFIPVVIALGTGLRRGEILGLTWSSVDIERSTITVSRSIEQTQDGLRVKEPKTHRSRRPVKMPDSLRRILKKHKAAAMLLSGPDFGENDYVCLKDDGTVWSPDTLSSRFTKLISRLEITSISFHDLRHTFATISLQQGIHPKIVSEMLGHSSVNITLDTYSHVLPSMQDMAAARIDEILRDVISRSQ